MNYIETHAHLDMIKRETATVIADANQKGVNKIITVGIDLESSQSIIHYPLKYKGIYTAVGFHPHESKGLSPDKLMVLEKLAQSTGNVAIGEIGLDYYYQHSPMEIQKSVFRMQLDLARKLQLPVLIHDRDAHLDTIKILDEKAQGLKIILHCFSGDLKMAQWCAQKGFYLGIGGVVTFKNAQKLRKIVETIPLKQLLLETDSPFLTPHPYRGKSNEPQNIPIIAQKIAEVKGVDLKQIAAQTTQNANVIFEWYD